MEWTDVKPVLEATYRLLAESDRVTGQDVNRALGRTPDDEVTGRALEQLHKADYVRGHFVMQSSLPVLIESTE